MPVKVKVVYWWVFVIEVASDEAILFSLVVDEGTKAG